MNSQILYTCFTQTYDLFPTGWVQGAQFSFSQHCVEVPKRATPYQDNLKTCLIFSINTNYLAGLAGNLSPSHTK